MISEMNLIRLLIHNDKFREKVLADIDGSMFESQRCREVYDLLVSYHKEYGKYPKENIQVLVMNNNLQQPSEIIKDKLNIVNCEPSNYETEDIDSYLKDTEIWWKTRSFGLLTENVVSMFNEKKSKDLKMISEDLEKIEAFSFSDNDWLTCYDDDFMIERYTTDERRIAFKSSAINEMLGGGTKSKSLNIIMGGTHVGKTRLMHSFACDHIRASKDNIALYISLEINDVDIVEFFDTNILDMPHEEIKKRVRKDSNWYRKKKNEFREQNGEMIVVEWSTDRARPALIRSLLNEMIAKNKKPTAIFVDYVGILKPNGKYNNLYEKGAESSTELRAISQDYEIPIWSAVQPRREGAQKSASGGKGAEITDVSGSIAIVENCDFFMNIIQPDDMREQNRQLLHILKNRHYPNVHSTYLAELSKNIYKAEVVGRHNLKNDAEAVQNLSKESIDLVKEEDNVGEVDFDNMF